MTDLSAPPLQPCVLRILNGPLQGCEFPLTEPRTLFIVAPVDLLGKSTGPVSVPPEAIFVPLDHGGCNFEVLLEEAEPGGVTLRLLDGQARDSPLPVSAQRARGVCRLPCGCLTRIGHRKAWAAAPIRTSGSHSSMAAKHRRQMARWRIGAGAVDGVGRHLVGARTDTRKPMFVH